MSLNLWPTEAKQLRKTKAENLKSALSTCPRWPFSARIFCTFFLLLLPYSTSGLGTQFQFEPRVRVWPPPLACTLSLSLCFVARRFNFRLNAKQKVSLWPERKVAFACMLTCLDLELAKRGTRQKTLPYIWLAGSPRMATGQPFQLD